MAHTIAKARQVDPAPALGRGLSLLADLDREGACSLEQLARVTAWPKSSVARLLQSLILAGVVRRDPVTRRFHAVCRLMHIEGGHDRLRTVAARAMAQLAAATHQTIELHQVDATRPDTPLTMIDRCEPDDAAVRVLARIGFQRDLHELDAITQVTLAFSTPRIATSGGGVWAWQRGAKRRLNRTAVLQLVNNCRQRGAGVDVDTNTHGVFRYAAPILGPSEQLVAVVAIAQFVTPASPPRDDALSHAVADAAAVITRQINAFV